DTNPDLHALPIHEVTVPSFYLGVYELTVEEYAVVFADKEPAARELRQPVRASFDVSKQFIEKLRKKTGLPMRLPSEAEWEYACRSGTRTPYYFGCDPDELSAYGYVSGSDSNPFNEPSKVGQYLPNKFGLYDMLGNCAEWM